MRWLVSKPTHSSPWAAVIAACLVAFVSGCGGGTPHIQVKGALLNNNKALAAKESDQLTLAFFGQSQDGKDVYAPATYKWEDGTFVVVGEGKGIPPGKYKISLLWTAFEGSEDDDRFRGAFSQENTPLEYTVTADPNQEIVIDLSKKSVTKK